ncbi:glycosyltransferase family 2 protein [Pseudonocardia lacus]|uniref:glycosyltransferase family 2 protein n=1 Tax=Pseudonocardia lacus TaxID=2835865 RepID=UPI001BDBE103|nr:glycosyltransferase family 2 protein [Pseudonocardia lacus]
MTAPRLSIGLPVYNGEEYLAEALDSLLGQTYRDFELIISDNASTDGTADLCRHYAADPRIRYLRQPRNIGCAGNHNVVFEVARGELFKWASDDDLYGRDLLRRCIAVLDENPHVVAVHSWTATIDGQTGELARGLRYPLATGSERAPERFRSMLFDDGGDDDYAVIRSDVLRRIPLYGSHYRADRTLPAELSLHGPFRQVPDYLYFRRHHAGAAVREYASIRRFCVNYDERRANRLLHPVPRLVAEYVLGYVAAIRRAPLSAADKRACFGHLARWVADRALPRGSRLVDIGPVQRAEPTEDLVSIRDLVAGRADSTP